MTPFYQDEAVTLYHGDCLPIIAEIDPATVALVLTDPPYGVAEATDRFSRKRTALARSNDFPPVYGDDRPYDPTPLLRFPRVVLFGANHYADKLPPSASWLVWDKLDGLTTEKRIIGFDDNADVELAWTNLSGPARLLQHRWKGMLKDSEREDRRVHPTQKPVVLMERIIAAHTKPGDLILDPYAGSGPVLRAAKNLGRRAIGCEIVRDYCDVIVTRLQQMTLPLERAA
ncbi:MAG TPA: site-specific DNA-methyltransferase [Rhodothermales bacterium]|nr:site-specific DNA-methyltransferase [Rhodothermales bacterium]